MPTARLLAVTGVVLSMAVLLVSRPATPPQKALAADVLAPTPPMGWSSWDSYGPAIREDEVKANADAMAAKLKQFGWEYVSGQTARSHPPSDPRNSLEIRHDCAFAFKSA